MQLVPIGRVVLSGDRTAIRVFDRFWPATLNVDRFSHIIVLWWISGCDNPDDRSVLRVTPMGSRNAPVSGVFACRSPLRPNPIGLSVVRLLATDETSHSLIIDRIDAHDETPVVDIKPYMPSSDMVASPTVPEWFADNTPCHP